MPTGAIRLFVMDVDGTLTDGRIHLSADGTAWKSFDAHDGGAIALLRHAGIAAAIVSGRDCAITERRARELSVSEVRLGVSDKLSVTQELASALGLAADGVAYVGDDISDVPVLDWAGWSAAPANATPEAQAAADVVLRQRGGHGAVREAIEVMLRHEERWDEVLSAATHPEVPA